VTEPRRQQAALRLRVRIAALCVGLAAVTCSHAAVLTGKLQGVQDIIEQAEKNGAYRCAPVQLAMAKSHARFTQVELDEGYFSRAKKHYAIAETNANEAYELSPPEKCAPKEISVEVPEIPVVPKVGDKDGDGYKDDEDECPEVPEDFDAVEDEDGCPEDEDTDGDGLKDFALYCFEPESGACDDVCILDPEDPDGYEDDDGCPEPDNDLDSILDADDECPDDPEDPDGYEDDDGCPDEDNDGDTVKDVDDQCPNVEGVAEEKGCPAAPPPPPPPPKPEIEGVVIKDKKIEIMETVHFAFNKAMIKPQSYSILNKVVEVLKLYPEIKIEVQGHTDNKGNDFYNWCLSGSRAKSVKNYLIAHGIEPYRLTSVAYGETCPIDTNATADGRAKNRRVEFIRTDVDEIERQCPIPEVPGKKKKKCKKFKVYKIY
jgi:outer membrane protein OmpA-like peptidoglycan-associated protein